MKNDNGGMNCTFSSFLMATLIGVLATVVMRFFAELSWEGSIFVGILVLLVLGVIFNIVFCRELPSLDEVKAPGSSASTAKSSEAAAAPPAEKAPAPAPAPKPAPAPAPAAASGEGKRPEALKQARGGKADNLKEIKGIGPKLEKLCNSLGFYHFDQIAGWTADEVAWVDENLEGFKGRVTRDEWVKQAKILATGGETEFSKRVEDGDVY
ncbi:MAG: NADH:ubiquinone oxidoreductase [Pseudomonadota bacterium]